MPELIDVLDAGGHSTGVTKLKRDIHRDGDWHRAAHLWIVSTSRHVLLQRRSLKKENHPGLWDVSVAGHVSAGESAVDAIVREAFEEIGLVIEAAELQSLATIREECVLNGGTYIDREVHEVFIRRHHVDVAALRLQPEEVDDVALVSMADLRERVARRDPTLVPHAEEYALLLKRLEDA